MRHSALAVSATVLVGVGLVSARLSAQAGPSELELRGKALRSLQQALQGGKALALVQRADQLPRQPVDCGMPVIKADPSIDPQIVKHPPKDGVHYTLRVILAPRCPQASTPPSFSSAPR